ncbi:IS5 family transposase [Sphingomonas sp. HF-S3]|uniref:IS5 family transposase n=1 Tax=Sphingomonas rustica TaxID=3103142 RepID=A0ABV0BEJ2_9SPHN
MVEKRTGQFSFVEALAPQLSSGSGRLDRLHDLVKWYRFEKVLSSLRHGGGRPAYPAVMMFKVLLLQSLYGLSDAETEEALSDRLSFRRFVGLSLSDGVPDHSTVCRFRNLLVEQGMLEKLFAELDRQLDKAGLILRRGTMLDATVIETSAARPDGPDRPSSDPDARFTRHQGRQGSSFGYKMHVGVDQGSGLIRTAITTPANVNDTVPADDLIRGDERAVLADAAYHTHARQAALAARGIKPRLMRRPNKHHPVLPPRLKRYNRLIGYQRAAVETTFATLKRRMGQKVIRYRGLAKASAQMLLAAMAFNMRRWVALSTA